MAIGRYEREQIDAANATGREAADTALAFVERFA